MNKILIAFFTITMAFSGIKMQAQKFPGLDASPMDMAIYRAPDKSLAVRVIYSRPQKKGRKVFGELEKYGKVWRTGANESTEITFYKNIMIGDEEVEAGTYTLYTIPDEKEWTVILNKDLNTWGAFGYKEESDVVRIKAPARTAKEPIEAFSITFEPTDDGATMLMGWDETYIEIPLKDI